MYIIFLEETTFLDYNPIFIDLSDVNGKNKNNETVINDIHTHDIDENINQFIYFDKINDEKTKVLNIIGLPNKDNVSCYANATI